MEIGVLESTARLLGGFEYDFCFFDIKEVKGQV